MRSCLAATLIAIAVAGCETTVVSQIHEPPAGPVSELRVVYVHNPMRLEPAAQSSKRSADPSVRNLEEVGYAALPRLVDTHARDVMTRNGIAAVVSSAHSYGRKYVDSRPADASRGRLKLLVLQIDGGRVTENTGFRTATVTFDVTADLLDETWSRRVWSGAFPVAASGSVDGSSARSKLIDQRLVEEMLAKVLAQLRADGFIRARPP